MPRAQNQNDDTKNDPTKAPARKQGSTVPAAEITIASNFLTIMSSLLSRRSKYGWISRLV
jgi:hypothetical protein